MSALLVRLVGFTALATLGALSWPRMIEDEPASVALPSLGIAIGAALVLIVLAQLGRRGRRLAPLVAVAALFGAVAIDATDVSSLFTPGGWSELASGVGASLEVLPGLRLPYGGSEPWSLYTLRAGGSLLLVVAALIAFWPRRGERAGWPVVALALVVAVYAVPAIALGSPAPLAEGVLLAVLVAAFLGLERLQRRDLAVAGVLTLAALAVAVPVAVALDQDRPLLDYEAVAQDLADRNPVDFTWDHGYGPIDWSRDGRVVLRVSAGRAEYWTAQHLNHFDGNRWTAGDAAFYDIEEPYTLPGRRQRIVVRVRDLRSSTVIGAGRTLAVFGVPRPLIRGPSPGTFAVADPLRRGDTYRAYVDVPKPQPFDLAVARSGLDPAFAPYRSLDIDNTSVTFPAFGTGRAPDLSDTPYARTAALVNRLKAASESPYAFVRRVEGYLARDEFTYSEFPPEHAEAPLDKFLFDDREGYCQQYSGAMALMLRMGGVPARVVAGFTPGTFNGERREWIVRDTDAHSWVEAFFDGYGWVRFDPTPSASPAASRETSGGDDAGLDLGGVFSTPEFGGRGGPDGAGAPDARDGGPGGPLDATGTPTAGDAGGDSGAGEWWYWPVLALLGAGVVGAVALLRRRRRAPIPPDVEELNRLRRALAAIGLALDPNTTLSALEGRLAGIPGAQAYVQALRERRYAPDRRPPLRALRRAARRDLSRRRGPFARLRLRWYLSGRGGGI